MLQQTKNVSKIVQKKFKSTAIMKFSLIVDYCEQYFFVLYYTSRITSSDMGIRVYVMCYPCLIYRFDLFNALTPFSIFVISKVVRCGSSSASLFLHYEGSRSYFRVFISLLEVRNVTCYSIRNHFFFVF